MVNQKLLIVLVTSQLVLWFSYFYFISSNPQSKFWGNIPENKWKEFLIYAAIAYILNLSLYFYFAFKKDVPDKIINMVILTLILYYGLQLFFLPLVLYGNKLAVKILLFLCILPLSYLAYISIQYSNTLDSNAEKIFLYVSSLLPLAHIVINDFVRYGFSF
jgi:hypothetical protein